MPNIKMPDGQVVNFPDDMAPDDIRGAVSSRFPDISQPEGNMLGKVMEFGSAMGKNIKGAAMQGVGGVARTWGETNQLDKLIVDPEWSAADNPPTELQNKVAKWGQEFGDAGAKISNDERRKYADSWGAGVAMDVTGALAQSSPGLIAGLATRSAQVGLAAFTPQVWGMQYGESRREGKSIAEAMHETRFKTSMEVGTELIPLKWAIGPGKTAMKRILDVTVGEGIQEALNEFMNAGYDAGVYDDKTPMSKAMGDWLMSSDTYKNAGYAAFIGSIAGGAMGAAAHPFVPSNEKMVGQALDKMITGTPRALVGANYDALGMGPGGGPVNIRPGSNPSWNEGSAFNPNMPAGVKESFADGLASMDQSVGDAAIHTDSPLHSQAFDDMAPLIPIMPLIDRFGSADPVMANVASVRVTGEPLKVSDDVLAAMGRAESDINLKRPAVAEVADEMWRIASPEFNPSQKGYKVYVHAGAHMIEDPEVMTDVATFDTEFAARTYMHLVKARAEVMPEAMGMPEPELILQTDTPEFKSWFGDSQVTSSEGAPMVVWHGSPVHDFDVFDTGKINSNDPDAPYNGFWFSPEMDWLRKCIDETQVGVTGTARIKLFKGQCTVAGRKASEAVSLYVPDFATFEEETVFDQADSTGFIRVNALRLRINALKKRKKS